MRSPPDPKSRDNGAFWTFSRAISGMIAVSYVAIAAIYSEPHVWILAAVFCVLPLACIWFSDHLAKVSFRRRVPNRWPAWLMAFPGWVVLLSGPFLYWLIGQWFP